MQLTHYQVNRFGQLRAFFLQTFRVSGKKLELFELRVTYKHTHGVGVEFALDLFVCLCNTTASQFLLYNGQNSPRKSVKEEISNCLHGGYLCESNTHSHSENSTQPVRGYPMFDFWPTTITFDSKRVTCQPRLGPCSKEKVKVLEKLYFFYYLEDPSFLLFHYIHYLNIIWQ